MKELTLREVELHKQGHTGNRYCIGIQILHTKASVLDITVFSALKTLNDTDPGACPDHFSRLAGTECPFLVLCKWFMRSKVEAAWYVETLALFSDATDPVPGTVTYYSYDFGDVIRPLKSQSSFL